MKRTKKKSGDTKRSGTRKGGTQKQAPAQRPPKLVRKREAMQLEQQAERKRKFSDELVYQTIVEMCAAAGPDGSVRPEEVARALYPEKWQTLLKRVRLFAGKLAERGDIVILRKGQVLDPAEDDVKGIIRLRIGAGDSAESPPDPAIDTL